MLKNLLLPLISLLLLVGSVAQAQSNFRPGYVVNAAGDTTRGEVDYQSSQRASRGVRFRASSSGTATAYTPTNLRGYGIAGDQAYEAIRVPTSRTSPDTALVQRLFLEVLVRGRLGLYYLNDASAGEVYYLRAGTGPLEPLWSWRETTYNESGQKLWQERPEFRSTLNVAMRDCPTVRAKVATTSYQLSQLVALVRSYNECVDGSSQPSTAAVLTSHASKFIFTAVAGAQTSTLRFKENTSLNEYTFQSGTAPTVGLGLEIQTTILARRISFVLDALYSPQRYGNASNSPYGNGISVELKGNFDQIRFPLAVRYTLPKGAVRPFVGAGVGLAYAFNLKQEYRSVRSVPPDTFYGNWRYLFNRGLNEPDYGLRRLEQSLVGSVGVRTARPRGRNGSLELRTERGNGFVGTGFVEIFNVSAPVNRYLLLLRYDLTK